MEEKRLPPKNKKATQKRAQADAPMIRRVEAFAPIIRAMRAEGLSLRAIAERLNEGEVATPRGGKWSASSVQRLAKRLGL